MSLNTKGAVAATQQRRLLRAERGMTQAEQADLDGVTQQAVSKSLKKARTAEKERLSALLRG